jgi:hypothetical protein
MTAPVYILIDTSKAMSGEPFQAMKTVLNDVVSILQEETYLDTSCCIISFAQQAEVTRGLSSWKDNPELPELASAEEVNADSGFECLCRCFNENSQNENANLIIITSGTAPSETIQKEFKKCSFGKILVLYHFDHNEYVHTSLNDFYESITMEILSTQDLLSTVVFPSFIRDPAPDRDEERKRSWAKSKRTETRYGRRIESIQDEVSELEREKQTLEQSLEDTKKNLQEVEGQSANQAGTEQEVSEIKQEKQNLEQLLKDKEKDLQDVERRLRYSVSWKEKYEILRERDAAFQERDVALRERDAALQERDAALQEPDDTFQEPDDPRFLRWDSVSQEIDDYEKNVVTLAVAEKDNAVFQKNAAIIADDGFHSFQELDNYKKNVVTPAVAEKDNAVFQKWAAIIAAACVVLFASGLISYFRHSTAAANRIASQSDARIAAIQTETDKKVKDAEQNAADQIAKIETGTNMEIAGAEAAKNLAIQSANESANENANKRIAKIEAAAQAKVNEADKKVNDAETLIAKIKKQTQQEIQQAKNDAQTMITQKEENYNNKVAALNV